MILYYCVPIIKNYLFVGAWELETSKFKIPSSFRKIKENRKCLRKIGFWQNRFWFFGVTLKQMTVATLNFY